MQQQHVLTEQITCLLIGTSPTTHQTGALQCCPYLGLHISGPDFRSWVSLLAVDTLCLCCSLRAERLSWIPRSSRAWRHQRGRA